MIENCEHDKGNRYESGENTQTTIFFFEVEMKESSIMYHEEE
jgi:hypothetical protein